MKVIYNKFIPFKGYKAMNLFGIVFVRKGAKFDTYARDVVDILLLMVCNRVPNNHVLC